MVTFWRRPVLSSQMSDTATPTAATADAQVSAILKRVASTGSLPTIVTSPGSGMPRPRTAMISSNAVDIARPLWSRPVWRGDGGWYMAPRPQRDGGGDGGGVEKRGGRVWG